MLFLEKILIANILAFAKGINLFLEQQVKVKIEKILHSKTLSYKGVKLIGLDVRFATNFFLPNYIGLGKSVSHGYGIVKQIKPLQDEL